jgi:hypothetical protein
MLSERTGPSGKTYEKQGRGGVKVNRYGTDNGQICLTVGAKGGSQDDV